MANVVGALTSSRTFVRSPRARTIAFWATTAILAGELALGGAWDILRIQYVFGLVIHDLGYPEYFLVILGAWKVLGAVTLLVPGFPRLKEWAYAGAFFSYSGAVASLIAMGYGIDQWSAPAQFGLILMASWVLRPASRRDFGSH